MSTKLSFRIYAGDKKRYLKGWKEATKHFIGFSNDRDDNTIINISFDTGEPDTYYRLEQVKR